MLEKFDSVESVLFWFCKCKALRYDLLQKNYSGVEKVCSIDDIDIVLNRLLMAGVISKHHIKVLKKYYDQSIIPAVGNDDEDDVFLWENLVCVLIPIFIKKGFLKLDICSYNNDCDDFKDKSGFKDSKNKSSFFRNIL